LQAATHNAINSIHIEAHLQENADAPAFLRKVEKSIKKSWQTVDILFEMLYNEDMKCISREKRAKIPYQTN
jgi:hypothetical protein